VFSWLLQLKPSILHAGPGEQCHATSPDDRHQELPATPYGSSCTPARAWFDFNHDPRCGNERVPVGRGRPDQRPPDSKAHQPTPPEIPHLVSHGVLIGRGPADTVCCEGKRAEGQRTGRCRGMLRPPAPASMTSGLTRSDADASAAGLADACPPY
jgi:hypothetical protein